MFTTPALAKQPDVTQSLRDAENSLRDFISALLMAEFGSEWLPKCGVTEDRLEKWNERRLVEQKRQETGVVDERLLYYADFFDLKTILSKHWQLFADALGDKKTFDVYLTELEKLRDPDAHRRELLPHQKHLIIGIAGEIRTRIVRYRSRRETSADCFPRIESARDSLGNIWTPDAQEGFQSVHTEMALRPGDCVDFVVTASDPEALPLEYAMTVGSSHPKWTLSNEMALEILEEHIGKTFVVALRIRSPRTYHARHGCDDMVEFAYEVLPRRQAEVVS